MNKRKTLLQKFIEFSADKRMASAKKKTLLAVSGGIDSVVMCSLFAEAAFPFGIAHCNFQLRGKESEGDEQLVKSLAKKYGVDFYSKKFETGSYAKEKSISIQVAARELRYEWFEQVRTENNFYLIATAHQLNDNIETILFNFTKGTGIRGLRGIPVRQGNIVRPLLFASRDEIENYQKEKGLEYREDSSNAEDKYTRNKIRHHVIPLLKEINPSLENTFAEKVDLFGELERMYERQVSKSAAKMFLPRGKDIYIPLLLLKKTENASTVLFEYLKGFGFNAEHADDMLQSVDAEPGKQFVTATARVIKDRRFFILTKLSEVNESVQFIAEKDSEVSLGEKKLEIGKQRLEVRGQRSEVRGQKSEVRGEKSEIKITADRKTAYLDKAKLEFPLIARRWKQGDYFYPFGMKMKKKKLKKFFTDEKVPLHEKENIWVIESNKKIVWVAGYRIDERFKVTDATTEVLKLQIKSS